MNRGLRAAAMAALLLSPVALTACSAGQVTQTAEQERDTAGNMAAVGDLALRAVQLPYPTGGVYPTGSDARLLAAVTSTATTDDTLVAVEGDFDSVDVVDPDAPADAATDSSTLDLTVPAGGVLFLGSGTGPSVTLVGLADEVGVGQYVPVTFSFEQAGDVTVQVPVATSTRDLPRGEPFDFHEGEAENGVEGGGS